MGKQERVYKHLFSNMRGVCIFWALWDLLCGWHMLKKDSGADELHPEKLIAAVSDHRLSIFRRHTVNFVSVFQVPEPGSNIADNWKMCHSIRGVSREYMHKNGNREFNAN